MPIGLLFGLAYCSLWSAIIPCVVSDLLFQGMTYSKHSRRMVPTSRSQ
jgi:hypothetical protein